MSFMENKFMDDFKKILAHYSTSPFGFRLRKTGRSLKLLEYNGLHYLNIQNLFNIVDELLGPNIPNEIIPYLENIIFSEEITIETKNGLEMKEVTCVQFIDERFFEKCAEWLDRKMNSFNQSSKENAQNLLSPVQKPLNNFLMDDFYCFDNFTPFKGFEGEDYSLDKIQQLKSERYMSDPRVLGKAYGGIARPRGKNMENISKNSKDRPFACDVPFCDRAFKRHEHLKRHIKMHSGERPFKCTYPGCLKSFSRSDNLNQHLRTHSIGMKRKDAFRNLLHKNSRQY